MYSRNICHRDSVNGGFIAICVVILVAFVIVYIIILDNGSIKTKVAVQPPWHRWNNISSASQVEESNVTEHTDQNFLLSVHYQQQTTASFITYIQLAKLAGLLNLSSVVPYVHKLGLEGGANYKDRHKLKLSNLYNFTHMKNAMKSCCANTDLKTFEEFIDGASQHVVLVSFITSTHQHQFTFLKGRNIVEFDCSMKTPIIKSSMRRLNSWALGEQLFNCSRVVLLDARPKHELPLRDVIHVLGSIVQEQVVKFGSATVVLDTWRGIHSTPDSTFFSYVPGFTTNGCSATRTIKHSDLVISAAHRFVERFNLTQTAVGVHIRGERLLRDSKWNIKYSIDCLQQIYNFLQDHSVSYPVPKPVYVFHDLGRYGSVSCSKECKKGRTKLLSKIKQLKFRVVYFDPSTFKSFPNSGIFASFVEKEYLSHVQVLVTVGQGGFQQSIVNRFLEYSRGTDKHLHRICNPILSP